MSQKILPFLAFDPNAVSGPIPFNDEDVRLIDVSAILNFLYICNIFRYISSFRYTTKNIRYITNTFCYIVSIYVVI